MLEDALADVAREKQRVLTQGGKGAEEGKLGRSQILRLIDDDMVEWLALPTCIVGRSLPP